MLTLLKILKPGEFANANWRAKNLPAGKVDAWLVVLQNVGIAMEICRDPDVLQLFKKSNQRIYDAL
jgi:hypothetical protein